MKEHQTQNQPWLSTCVKQDIAWKDSRIITTNNGYGQQLCLKA